jgi:mannosylglycerate hydrolase MGH1-like protein
MVDLDFAKHQLDLMLQEVYLHPNGQIPAYEWNFGDVNPPVHAWATVHLYNIERARTGRGDIEFLRGAFQKLLLNFTWWVNRKDRDGRNVFEGGFLGLDNIGVFDRSSPLPTGGYLEQADGTAWMALFSQNMLQIALELAVVDESYEAMAIKFVEHFFWIAGAMDRLGINPDEMWDEEDGFFYDVLRFPDGRAERIKVRSLVGLLPLCATTVIPEQITQRFPRLIQKIGKFVRKWPELVANLQNPETPGVGGRLLAILDEKKLRRVLARMLDEQRFLSPFGIRSLSHWHLDHPYIFAVNGDEYRVQYMPAESSNCMFGGNSNWRGPIWMPLNMLIVSALLQFYEYYGDTFRIECPTGSGHTMTLSEIADAISRRLCSIFLIDANGRRPVYGGSEVFQKDPYWRDLILFYEYFHGDNGAGLGASHQTGWTGLVASLLQQGGCLKATRSRAEGRAPGADAYQEVPSGGILP